MNLAFCLFNYFPYGGLQRDFLHIAHECKKRGHDIHVYTMQWDGELEPLFQLHLIETKRWQNHARGNDFAEQVKPMLAAHDLVIGFNKMPYLDVYYAADVCYQARIKKKRGSWYRLLPRYRQWAALEKAVFAAGNQTEIMLIAPAQQAEFMRCYQTEPNRFHLLPPVLARDRKKPEDAPAIRAKLRKMHHISEEQILLLLIGSRFKVKGLDRAILALSALPDELKARCQLLVLGQDDPKPFLKLAERMKVMQQLHFLGGRNDVPDFLLAADLLLHPAYLENTGTVLLEAMALGLPILTVDICGYAHYVAEAKAGKVLPSPFQQTELNLALQKMLSSTDMQTFRQNADVFAKREDIYNMPKEAALIIESVGRKRNAISS